MLLSQPEILKKMSNLNKSGKVNVTETSTSYSSKYRKEQVKKQMKMKVDYAAHTQNRNQQIQKIMKEVEKNEQSEIIENIVNKDISTQEENFKKRLEEKKKKSLLCTSDLTDHLETIKNKRGEGKAVNRSLIIEGRSANNEPINIMQEVEGDNINLNLSLTKEINGNPNPDEIAHDDNKDNNFLHSFDNSFEEKIDKKKMDEIDGNISFDAGNDLSGTHKKNSKTSKQNQLLTDMKSNMDSFLDEFNYYFFEDVFTNVVEEIQKILEEKHAKTLEISKSYNNQIKEYEFLLSTGTLFNYF